MGLQFAGRWFGRCPASTLESICLAVDTNGCPVYIDWCERHLLTIGESDSGKGSVLANLLVQVEPFAQAGLVRLYGIDLKAMELSMSRAMFQTVAIDVESAAELVSSFRNAMNQRARDMAGSARMHTPTPDNPRNILVIDELAELFRQDAKVSSSSSTISQLSLAWVARRGIWSGASAKTPARRRFRFAMTSTVRRSLCAWASRRQR